MKNLKLLRKQSNLTLKELGSILNVSESTVSMYESGKREPDYDILKNMANFFNVSIDYLLDRNNLFNDKLNNNSVKIPVLGVIHAGLPMEAVENIIDYEEISLEMANKGEYFALKVCGDSMMPKYLDGDIVIVRKQNDAPNGKVCVVLVNGDDATLKRIKKDANGILLIPDNPAYTTIQYSNEEIENIPVRIIGQVVELRRSENL